MPAAVQYVRAAAADGALDLRAAIARARQPPGRARGPGRGRAALNAQLLTLGLIDELFLSLAPVLAGGDDLLSIVAPSGGSAPTTLQLAGVHAAESQLFLRYRVADSQRSNVTAVSDVRAAAERHRRGAGQAARVPRRPPGAAGPLPVRARHRRARRRVSAGAVARAVADRRARRRQRARRRSRDRHRRRAAPSGCAARRSTGARTPPAAASSSRIRTGRRVDDALQERVREVLERDVNPGIAAARWPRRPRGRRGPHRLRADVGRLPGLRHGLGHPHPGHRGDAHRGPAGDRRRGRRHRPRRRARTRTTRPRSGARAAPPRRPPPARVEMAHVRGQRRQGAEADGRQCAKPATGGQGERASRALRSARVRVIARM